MTTVSHSAALTDSVIAANAVRYDSCGKYNHCRPPHPATLPSGYSVATPASTVESPPCPPLPCRRTTQRLAETPWLDVADPASSQLVQPTADAPRMPKVARTRPRRWKRKFMAVTVPGCRRPRGATIAGSPIRSSQKKGGTWRSSDGSSRWPWPPAHAAPPTTAHQTLALQRCQPSRCQCPTAPTAST